LETPGSRREYGGQTFTQGTGGQQWTDRYGRGWGTGSMPPQQQQQQQFGGGPGKGGRGQPSPQQFPGGPGKGGGGYRQPAPQQFPGGPGKGGSQPPPRGFPGGPGKGGGGYQTGQLQQAQQLGQLGQAQQLGQLGQAQQLEQQVPFDPDGIIYDGGPGGWGGGQAPPERMNGAAAAPARMPEYARPAYEEMMGRSAQEQRALGGQQGLDTGYQNFQREQEYPRQRLAALSQQLQGMPIQPAGLPMPEYARPAYEEMMGRSAQEQRALGGQEQALGGLGGGVGMYKGMQNGPELIGEQGPPPSKDQAVGIGDFEQKQIADQPSVTPQRWTPQQKAAWGQQQQAQAPITPQRWTPQQKAAWGQQQQMQTQQVSPRWTPAQQRAWRAGRRANGGIVGLYWPGGRVY